MKHLLLVLGTAVMVLPSLAGANAHGDIIGTNWSATVSFSSPAFGGWNPNYSSTWIPEYGQTVPYNGKQYFRVGEATLPIKVLTPSYDHVPWTAQLTLFDNKTNTSGTLTFTGLLNGGPPNITNTITGPSEQSLNLGGDHWDVTFIPFIPTFKPELLLPTGWTSPPYSPQKSFGNPSQGWVYASIMENGMVPAPEPSSVVLACLGALGLATRLGWRRVKVLGTVLRS